MVVPNKDQKNGKPQRLPANLRGSRLSRRFPQYAQELGERRESRGLPSPCERLQTVPEDRLGRTSPESDPQPSRAPSRNEQAPIKELARRYGCTPLE